MGAMDFLKAGLKNIRTTGTITRSSAFLCRKVIEHIDFANARILVELGAGDGVITRHILAAMHPEAKLLAFEILPDLYEKLSGIEDERLIAVQDSAEKIGAYLEKNGFGNADYMVSALPFAAFADELTDRILTEAYANLKTGGQYSQIQYSTVTKKLYEKYFGKMRVNYTLLNIPPAFVFISQPKEN